MEPLMSNSMTDGYQAEKIDKLEKLLKIVISRVTDGWNKGEADILIEIRQERKGGEKRAKVKGGAVERI
jgi:hypothetical protein